MISLLQLVTDLIKKLGLHTLQANINKQNMKGYVKTSRKLSVRKATRVRIHTYMR